MDRRDVEEDQSRLVGALIVAALILLIACELALISAIVVWWAKFGGML